ncbi:MAG: PASTA domain-containing protein [Bacteroidales bacterium]
MKSPIVKFLLSRVFWKNILFALLITIVLILLVQVSLSLYTGHGKKVRVPDFSGLSLGETDRICASNELLWLIQDSIYQKEVPGGSVLDQYPLPGSYVKKNRKIHLIVNAWQPEMIKMPKAYDMPYRQAERVLQGAGLFVASTEYVPFFAKTYVLEQKYEGQPILEGTLIEQGSGITLVIGGGLSNQRAPVPFLLALSRQDALKDALNNYFNLGAVKYDLSVLNGQDSLLARIYRQFPEAGSPAQLGFTIDIWLTVDSLKLMEHLQVTGPDGDYLNDTLELEQ